MTSLYERPFIAQLERLLAGEQPLIQVLVSSAWTAWLLAGFPVAHLIKLVSRVILEKQFHAN